MDEDIVTRLRTPYVEPCICVDVVRVECRSCCDRIDARAEIVLLRSALAVASGMISTMPPYEHQHPESVMEMLLVEARRG